MPFIYPVEQHSLFQLEVGQIPREKKKNQNEAFQDSWKQLVFYSTPNNQKHVGSAFSSMSSPIWAECALRAMFLALTASLMRSTSCW